MRWSAVRLLALAAAAILTACDASTPMDAPSARPSYDAVPGNDGKQYKVVEGDIHGEPKSASAWIDRKGGYVILQGPDKDGHPTMHGLYVPKNAVNKETLFEIRSLGGHKVGVRLDARIQNKNGTWTEVGSKGFREDVVLFMSYAWATNVTDASRIVILYDPEDGKAHEPTRSFVYGQDNAYVVAALPHFSKYVMAVH